jgi:hypothetical protein
MAAARGSGECVDGAEGAAEVFDAHERRRAHPDGRAAKAEHVGQLTVDAGVLVHEIHGWSAEPGGAGLRVLVAMLAEDAASLVNPKRGDRRDPVPGGVVRGGASGMPDLKEC